MSDVDLLFGEKSPVSGRLVALIAFHLAPETDPATARASVEKASYLVRRILGSMKAAPAAKEATIRFAENPQDSQREAAFRGELEKIFAANAAMANLLRDLIKQAEKQASANPAKDNDPSAKVAAAGPADVKPAASGAEKDAAVRQHVEESAAEKTAFPGPQHSIGKPDANFVERPGKLDELRRCAAKESVQIVGLRGMGGGGKTQLARRFAMELAARFKDGNFEIDLAGFSESPVKTSTLVERVVRAFALGPLPDICLRPGEELSPAAIEKRTVEAWSGVMRAALHGKKILFLLDNSRAAEQIAPFLPPPPGCFVIVTSRQMFDIGGEQVKAAEMERSEARDLLKRIHDNEGREPLSDNHAEAIAIACRRVPLALRLAASLLRKRPDVKPSDYLAGLAEQQRSSAIGKDESRTIEQMTLFAPFQSTYDQLKGGNQKRFSALGVFNSKFDMAALQALWDVPADVASDVISEFMGCGLLDFDAEDQQYSVHDLLAEFALAKLDDAGCVEFIERFVRHFTKVGTEADQLYLKGGEAVAHGLALFDRQRWHIERAFEMLDTYVRGSLRGSASPQASDTIALNPLQTRFAPLLVALVNATAHVSNQRFHLRARRIPWLMAQLGAARIIQDRRYEGAALSSLGHAYADLGEQRKAVEFFEQRLVIVREIEDRRGEGNALGNLGMAHAALGDLRTAAGFYEQQLVIAREIGYQTGEVNALGNLGVAWRDLGEPQKTVEYHEQALVIVRETGDKPAEDSILNSLGNAYAKLGETRKAADFYEQRLAVTREIGDRRAEGNALFNAALAHEKLRERKRAIALAQEALKILDPLADPLAEQVRAMLSEWPDWD